MLFGIMRIGFYQFNPKLGNIACNLRRIEETLSTVKNLDLIVLPELCNSGYNFRNRKEALRLSEPVPQGPTTQSWIKLCRKKNFYLVAGINEFERDKIYNSVVLVSPQGYIGKFRKLHLFLNEKKYFQPGNLGLPVFKIKGVKIGILICFDWQFPEAWRILALKGAQIICHPSNLIIPELSFRALQGHALVNRVFVVTANRIGAERGLKFIGNSTIWNTKGEVLAQASPNKEEIKIVEIEPNQAKLKQATPLNHIFQDMRIRYPRRLLSDKPVRF